MLLFSLTSKPGGLMRYLTIAFCIALVLFSLQQAQADIPKLINYQGMLTQSDGATPVQDGTYDLGFKIYGSESGTDSLWWEYHSGVQVTNGLFNVILGSQSVLNLPFDSDYWLETTVETEIMPTRLQFTSVGYAYRALVADSAMVAVSAPTGGGWTDDGSVVRLVSNTDKVGIGTTSPQAGLHLKGAGWPSSFMYLQSDSDQDAGIRLYEGADVRWHIFNSSADSGLRIYNSDGSKTVFFAEQSSGKVGIGTSTPSDKLDVEGNINVSSNRIKDYYGFPRPDYDSGWRPISQNQTLTLTHNIGGDVDNYFVDLWFKGAVGRHNYAYGGEIDPAWDYRGAYWRELTGTQIEVYRNPDDGSVTEVRVRIWVYQ